MRAHAPPLPRRKHRNRCLSVAIPYVWLLFLVGATGFAWWGMFYQGYWTSAILCMSDGSVWLPWQNEFTDPGAGPSYWGLDQTLAITLGFGSFTFAQAKGIDTSFNLVVGRGGQLLLAYACYSIFRKAFARVMEVKTVTIEEFKAIAFEQVSLASCWTFGCGIPGACCCDRRRRKSTLDWRLACLFVTFVYILAYPTWIEAMTGYQTGVRPYVQDPGNANLVPTESWQLPALIVRDGSRVGLGDNFTLEAQPFYVTTSLYASVSGCFISLRELEPPLQSFSPHRSYSDGCTFDLPPDAKTIEDCTAFTWHNQNFDQTFNLSAPLLDVRPLDPGPSRNYIEFGDLKLDRSYVDTHTTCQPGQKYRWGVSQNLLLIFITWTAFFGVVMVALQQDAHHNSRSVRYDDTTEQCRDAQDLASELRDQFGERAEYMSAAELQKGIAHMPGAIGIDTSELMPSRCEERMLRRRERREKKDTGGASNMEKEEEGKERDVMVTAEELESNAPSVSGSR